MMILESLRRQPAHGYALVQHIQERSNNLLQVEEGSLYPALQRLLKAKLVKAKWVFRPRIAGRKPTSTTISRKRYVCISRHVEQLKREGLSPQESERQRSDER